MLSLSATTTDLQQNSSEQQSDKAEEWMSKMKLSFWRTNNTQATCDMQELMCQRRVALCTFGRVSIGEVGFVDGLEVAAPVTGPHIDAAVPPPCHQHGAPCTPCAT